ncbi:hypothetical protein WAI453_001265 [Rhynchosporium graminicola]
MQRRVNSGTLYIVVLLIPLPPGQMTLHSPQKQRDESPEQKEPDSSNIVESETFQLYIVLIPLKIAIIKRPKTVTNCIGRGGSNSNCV